MFKEKQILVRIDGKDIILDISLYSYREYSNFPANIVRTKIIAVHPSTKIFSFLIYRNPKQSIVVSNHVANHDI